MQKVCIITGGTSGIGLCTAQEMLAAGYEVYELSRRRDGRLGMHHIPTDITEENMVTAAVNLIMEQSGRIDVLINNAGYGLSGAVEFISTEEAMRQFDVNFFGIVRMNRAVLPIMRGQGFGRIINMGSVAAIYPLPFQAYYSATKAAVNSIPWRWPTRCFLSAWKCAAYSLAISRPTSLRPEERWQRVTISTEAASGTA